jgi:hypothetical protein
MSFPPGSPVRFQTARGERLGTVERVHAHDVHSVRPDDAVPTLLLAGWKLQIAEEADVPFFVMARFGAPE